MGDEDFIFMMSVFLVGFYFCVLNNRRPVVRRWWIRPTNQLRDTQGASQNFIRELREKDLKKYKRYMRMSGETFDKLLSIVANDITKRYCSRRPIDPCTKLEICIRYLATGESMTSIADQFRVGRSTAGVIIKDTLQAINKRLRPLVMPEPTTESWLFSAEGFWKRWNFPHCIGALDGKHINVEAPPGSGSIFYNYKGFHSSILMGVADYRYRFVLVDVGTPGRQSDSGVFRNSLMGQRFENNTMNVPTASPISAEGSQIPYFLVGDEAFGLKKYLQRPYPGRSTGRLEFHQRLFNYRLSRARRVIENSFGMLAAKWRIFRTPIQADVETVDEIILAAVYLHNFLLIEEDQQAPHQRTYCPPGFVDTEVDGKIVQGEWRRESAPTNTFFSIGPQGSNNQTGTQSGIREKLAQFFMTDGSVEWQWTHEFY